MCKKEDSSDFIFVYEMFKQKMKRVLHKFIIAFSLLNLNAKLNAHELTIKNI